MNLIQSFFHTVYNVPQLISIVGQFGLPLIIFAETGLLIGFFLPGDSLLITAGPFPARGAPRLPLLFVTPMPPGIPADATRHPTGERAGQTRSRPPATLVLRPP